jgi:hypothetical protein
MTDREPEQDDNKKAAPPRRVVDCVVIRDDGVLIIPDLSVWLAASDKLRERDG